MPAKSKQDACVAALIRLTRASVLTAALISALSGCSRVGEQRIVSDRLTLEDGFGQPASLNPWIDGTWPTAIVVGGLALAFLTRYDSDGNPVPDLAQEIPNRRNGGVSVDGRTITYRLRPHLRWSDGSPLTAADVVFTVQAVTDPRNNATPTSFEAISDVVAPDPRTVVFHLKRRYGNYARAFFSSLGPDGVTCILPRHLFRGKNIQQSSFNELPIGAGPFRVTAWHRNDAIEFQRNPYYRSTPARLSGVIYRLGDSVQTAGVNFASHTTQLWSRISEDAVASAAKSGAVALLEPDAYVHLDFNVTRPDVRDVQVRRAIRFALDRVAIAYNVTMGLAQTQEGVVRERTGDTSGPPFVARHQTQATRLLRGRRPTLDLAFPSGDAMLAKTAELIRAQLGPIGVTVTTRSYANSVYTSILRDGKWDLALFNWTMDPSHELGDFFSCKASAPAGSNYMRYCNPRLDRLMNHYLDAYNAKDRQVTLSREEQIIDRDVPTIVIFFRRWGYATSPVVKGFAPAPDTPFDTFASVGLR